MTTPHLRISPHSKDEFPSLYTLAAWLMTGLKERNGRYQLRSASAIADFAAGSIALFRHGHVVVGEAAVMRFCREPSRDRTLAGEEFEYEAFVEFMSSSIRIYAPPVLIETLQSFIGDSPNIVPSAQPYFKPDNWDDIQNYWRTSASREASFEVLGRQVRNRPNNAVDRTPAKAERSGAVASRPGAPHRKPLDDSCGERGIATLPLAGAVLGIDVGYSAKRRSTCFCLLEWSNTSIAVSFALVTADPTSRRTALSRLLGANRSLLAVGVDGPLVHGLGRATKYRAAEALLSQGCLQKRGKPGQTSSPVGQFLHEHAIQLARLSMELATVAPASHYQPIVTSCIVEAFPNLFLAALIPESNIPELRRDASDRYWELALPTALPDLFSRLLPQRTLVHDLSMIANHDERAGIVCALTALSVATASHIAVGAESDGDIILPPLDIWGEANDGRKWLERELVAALLSWPQKASRHDCRVATSFGPWDVPVVV